MFSGGKLVAEYTNTTPPSNPTVSYTATDLLGSPRVLTDSLGAVISRRDFLPFGEEVYADEANRTSAQKYTTTGDDGLRKRFTGYEKDKETQLDFAEARMYENRYGRFTAVDPLLASGKSGNPQTFNRYVYCLNSPLVFTDPTGLQVGKWYFPKDSDGNKINRPEYIKNGANTDGFVEASERNRAGDLVYTGEGINPDFVVRLNPMGPASVNNPLDLDDILLGSPYVRSGWDIIRSDESEDASIEHPADGYARGSEIAITPLDVALFAGPLKIGRGTSAAAATEGQISSRAFHSGVGTQEAAAAEGFSTLGQTRAGQNLDRLIQSKGIPWERAKPMWGRLSAAYAKGVPDRSIIKVFLNNPSAESIWLSIERPILLQKNVRILEEFVK